MSNTAQKTAMSTGVARVDMKFEVVVIPVSDVDRAKEFYGRLGWRFDADFRFDNGFHVVQFTPPGSACSIQFGTKITPAAPGSAQNLYLAVSDIEAAREPSALCGVTVSEVFHPGTRRIRKQSIAASSAGSSVPADRSHSRARAGSRHLPFLRHVQRPRWQRLAKGASCTEAPAEILFGDKVNHDSVPADHSVCFLSAQRHARTIRENGTQGPAFDNSVDELRVPGVPLDNVDINCHCYDVTKQVVLNPAAWTNPAPGQFGGTAL